MQEEVSKEKILSFLKELKPSLQKEGIKKIGLFGSYAKGYAQKSSDIDITILADMDTLTNKRKEITFLLSNLKDEVSSKFNKPVDLCIFFSQEKLNKAKKILKGVIYV